MTRMMYERSADANGNIVIPSMLLKEMNITADDLLLMYVEDGRLVIVKDGDEPQSDDEDTQATWEQITTP